MRRLLFCSLVIWILPIWVVASCGGGGGSGGGAGGLGGRDLMVPAKRIKTPDADFALITFVRSSIMAFGVKAMIWDGETLVGELTPRKYIQYKATPGTHLFLAKSEVWSYLKANLLPGKQYIITTEVYPGGNSARIVLKPVLPYEGEKTKRDVDEWLLGLYPEKAEPDYGPIYADPYLSETRRAIQAFEQGKADFATLNAGDDWPHLALHPPAEEEKK